MYAGILFDLDGVLVDSRVAIARSMNHALATLGLESWPEETLYGLIGPPLHDAFSEVLSAQAADPALTDACVARYRERYRTACVEETRPVEGIAEALAALAAAGRALAVATSKPVEFARPILETLGLAGSFRAVVGPALEARSEPKTATVGRALAALGARGPCAMVGDRLHDVVAGRAHGLATVGVTWGIGSAAELREAGADHLVDRPAELVALFSV